MKQVPVVCHFILLWVCSLLPLAAAATVPDGDVNTDGEVDIVDVLWGIQAVLGSRTLDPPQLAHGIDLVTVDPNPVLAFLHGKGIGTDRVSSLREYHQVTFFQCGNRRFQIADEFCHFHPAKDSPPSHERPQDVLVQGFYLRIASLLPLL